MYNVVKMSLACGAILTGASGAMAFEARFVKTPSLGCYDKSIVERATDLREEDRGYDFDNLLRTAVETGECRQLRPGLMVVIEDSDIVAGISKVRAQGEPRAVWVRYRALAED